MSGRQKLRNPGRSRPGGSQRDGQSDPVVAYFLVADSGSDPTMIDVLGVKRGQADGITDPTVDVLETQGDDGHRVRRLAEDYLRQKERRKTKAG